MISLAPRSYRNCVSLIFLPVLMLLLLIFIPRTFRRRKTRLGCRLNAGGVEWVERHGCRESRPWPWMADGGGPTERRRSEGTSTQSRPNREQTLGYLGLSSNSRKAKHRPLGRALWGIHKMSTAPHIQYWHLAIFNPFQELDRFLQYLRYNASGVKSLI